MHQKRIQEWSDRPFSWDSDFQWWYKGKPCNPKPESQPSTLDVDEHQAALPTPLSAAEIQSLRSEVHELRAEVAALRTDLEALHAEVGQAAQQVVQGWPVTHRGPGQHLCAGMGFLALVCSAMLLPCIFAQSMVKSKLPQEKFCYG